MTLVCNHEAMMVVSEHRYVYPGEYAAFVTESSKKPVSVVLGNQKTVYRRCSREVPEPVSDEIKVCCVLDEAPLGLTQHRASWRVDVLRSRAAVARQ